MTSLRSGRTTGFIVTLTVLGLLTAGAIAVCAEGAAFRFPDTGRLIGLFGFHDNRFDPVAAGDMQLDYEIESKLGRTEGDRSLDTVAEFITAVYYSRTHLSETARREFEAELPASESGALRLCSMWLFRMAEYPANAAGYREVLSLIRKKSRLSDSSIVDHYAGALEARLGAIAINGLAAKEEERFRQLVLMHLLDPVNPPTAAALRGFIQNQKSASPAKAAKAMDFLRAVSPAVAERFEEKAGARRG